MMQAIFKYPPDVYGRTLNMSSHTVQLERDNYCSEIKEPRNFPLSDEQHFDFEVKLSKKYRQEFIDYLKSIGGLEIGLKTIEAQGRKSNLLSYYMERRRRSERKTALPVQHGKARADDVA